MKHGMVWIESTTTKPQEKLAKAQPLCIIPGMCCIKVQIYQYGPFLLTWIIIYYSMETLSHSQ